MELAKTNTNAIANCDSKFQVIRTPGWVCYGEYASREDAQTAADAAQSTDEDGSVFVYEIDPPHPSVV